MILTERIMDKLLSGDLDFLDSFSSDFIDALTKDIVDSPYRGRILYESFNAIFDKNPKFAFLISLDLNEYEQFWRRHLETNHSLLFDYDCLLRALLFSSWAKKIVIEILEKITLAKKSSVLAKNEPVSVNTCVSAVQPKRSLRCGQSVGTER